jgi:transposase InsO family protein
MGVYIVAVTWGLIVWMIVGVWRLRRKRSVPGPAMFASMQELYDDQRRAAVQLVLEERAAARDLEHADDDVQQTDVCNQRTATRFIDEVVRRLPFRVHVVQTDNGAEFQSEFHWHLERLDIRHVSIRPRTPRLNGKVERSHRVDDQEFYPTRAASR